jgi:hypothetical protein
MQTAVRTHAISHDATLAHVLRMAIDDAEPADWEMASALLDLPVGESRSAFPARDALIVHAASGLDAALALAIARGERALTTDSFRWRLEIVSAHARLIRTTGIHQLTAVEEEVITERGLSRFRKFQYCHEQGIPPRAAGHPGSTSHLLTKHPRVLRREWHQWALIGYRAVG